MGTPGSTGGGRPLRTAGLALYALALVAAVIGLVLAVSRGERTTGTGKPAISATHAPVSGSTVPSVIPYPPPVISPSAEAPVVSPPGPPNAAEGAPAGDNGAGEMSASRGEVRVFNNSTIRGLATRAAGDLSAAGWTVVEVANYAQGTIPTTTVYYQEDTDRAAAEALAAQFKVRVEARFPGIEKIGPGLIVIVTNDYASP
ncbi:MAG: glycoprotein [Pseudonocardiales bacterium]|nr:LytR C-terminal domain-containing protein [Actinomycetota bacterium]PZS14503.1 MAG: glycoprotein [Pseudonocardiales bacterium]